MVNPDNVKLRNNLGMELKAAGRLEEAQHHYLVGPPLPESWISGCGSPESHGD